jgi:signal transduction histidine kinase
MSFVQTFNPLREEKIEAELYVLARSNLLVSILSPIVISGLMLVGFGDIPDPIRWSLWLTLLWASSLYATYLHVGFPTDVPAPHLRRSLFERWRRHNLYFLMLTGIAWGSSGLLFVPGQVVLNTSILLIYLGVAAGAVTTHGAHSLRAYFMSIACSALTMLPFMQVGFGEQTLTLAWLLCFYFVVIAYTTHNAQKTVLRSISLQLENEALLEEKAAAERQAERERIYRDLHDDVGAKLLGLAISAQRANQHKEADLARSALQDLRDVVSRPTHMASRLDHLLADWRAETEQRVRAAGLGFAWHATEIGDSSLVSPAAALHMGRILRESISNILHHARASKVFVAIERQSDRLLFQIQDDGIGVGEEMKSNRGMHNMQARASMLGGKISWEPHLPQGCKVTVEIAMSLLALDSVA